MRMPETSTNLTPEWNDIRTGLGNLLTSSNRSGNNRILTILLCNSCNHINHHSLRKIREVQDCGLVVSQV